MIAVSRMDLLGALDTVSPGLSAKDLVTQSSCFVFGNGRVYTYNDEISCRAKSPLPKDFEGAVEARPLASMLRLWPDEEIRLEPDDDKLVIRGKGRKASKFAFQKKAMLDTSAVESPGEWRDLPPEFAEAVALAVECSSRKWTPYLYNCVHVSPKCIEATDKHHLIRYRLKTGFSQSTLIRRDSIKHVVPLGMSRFAESDAWVHFRNDEGLTMSMRVGHDEFEDIGGVLKQGGGDPVSLPKTLVQAVERANVAAAENKTPQLLVRLRTGEIWVEGIGVNIEHGEPKKLDYKGADRDFVISPTLFSQIVEKHSDCEIADDRIRVKSEKWTYLASIGVPGSKHAEAEPQESE